MTRLTTSEILAVQELCRHSFPDRLDQHVSQFALEQDERHRALSFMLTWRESRRPRVERLHVRGYLDGWTVWTAGDPNQARRDWEVLRWLYGLGLPVPRVYAVGEDYVLMEQPTGRTIESLGQGWHKQVAAQIERFAFLLAQLHRRTPPDAVRQLLPVITLTELMAQLSRSARECLDGELDEAMSALKIWLGTESEGTSLCVLCGEAIFAYARIGAQGITLPCWQDAALGDPRWDVARAIGWLQVHHADDLSEHLLDAYRAQSDAALFNLDAWIALTALTNWALADRLRFQQPEHPRVAERNDWIELTWRALTRIKAQYETA